jgi:Zn-dependent protease
MLVIIRLGWAKPVPTSPIYYKNRKKGTLYVALAGPASGILLALIVRLAAASGVLRWTGIPVSFFNQIYFYSLVISVFNLLPVYPLDGSRILQGLLPDNRGMKLIQYQNQIQIVFILVLLLANRILWAFLNPVIGVFDFAISGVVGLFY